MENTKKTLVQEKGFTGRLKRFMCVVFGWDPGSCSIWIFGKDSSAKNDLHKFFDVEEDTSITL